MKMVNLRMTVYEARFIMTMLEQTMQDYAKQRNSNPSALFGMVRLQEDLTRQLNEQEEGEADEA